MFTGAPQAGSRIKVADTIRKSLRNNSPILFKDIIIKIMRNPMVFSNTAEHLSETSHYANLFPLASQFIFQLQGSF
jgi:hypothetical protein